MELETEKEAVKFFLEAFANLKTQKLALDKLIKEVKPIIGKTKQDIVKFLKRHSKFFQVDGENVTLLKQIRNKELHQEYRGQVYTEDVKRLLFEKHEKIAIQFFSDAFLKLGLKGLTVKSLFAKKSEATVDIFDVIGSTENDFAVFLKRHPSTFRVIGNYVELADKSKVNERSGISSDVERTAIEFFTNIVLASDHKRMALKELASMKSQAPPKVSKVFVDVDATCEFIKKHHKHFFVKNEKVSVASDLVESAKAIAKSRTAVAYLKGSIEKEGKTVTVHKLAQHVSVAPGYVQKEIGTYPPDVYRFVRLHKSTFFVDAKWRVGLYNFETGGFYPGMLPSFDEMPSPNEDIVGGVGIINRLQRLAGFINYNGVSRVYFSLEACEEVDDISDLQNVYMVGEKVYFNAVPGPPYASCEWRAVTVSKNISHFLEPKSLSCESGESNTFNLQDMLTLPDYQITTLPDLNCFLSVTPPILKNQKGVIVKLFKMLGFLKFKKGDVFFHRAQFVGMNHKSNLAQELNVGDLLFFNCEKGRPGSEAKWAATKIWRPRDTVHEQNDYNGNDDEKKNSLSVQVSKSLQCTAKCNVQYHSENTQFVLNAEHTKSHTNPKNEMLSEMILQEINSELSSEEHKPIMSSRDDNHVKPNPQSGTDDLLRNIAHKYSSASKSEGTEKEKCISRYAGDEDKVLTLINHKEMNLGNQQKGTTFANRDNSCALLQSLAKQKVSVACQTMSTGNIESTKFYIPETDVVLYV